MGATANGSSADDAADWLRRWQADGDREALGNLLALEVSALKARLRGRWDPRVTPDFGASDAAQEAVARMLRLETPPVFHTPRELRAYLWKAAWRLLVERLRERPGVRIDDGTPSELGSAFQASGGQSAVERSDRAAALQVALHLLQPEEQEILELAIARNLGIERAAAALGITPDTARGRCEKARKRLAHKLRGWSDLIG